MSLVVGMVHPNPDLPTCSGLVEGHNAARLALESQPEVRVVVLMPDHKQGNPLEGLDWSQVDVAWLSFVHHLTWLPGPLPVPTVLHWHGWFDDAVGFIWPRRPPWPERMTVLAKADHTVFSSWNLRQFVTGLAPDEPGSSTAAWNCADPRLFYPAPRTERSVGACALLNHSYAKGVDRLEGLGEVDLLGKSHPPPLDYVEPPLNAYGVNPLAHEDVGDFLREHELLIHPSRVESCPLTIVEALTCGLPVLCSDAGDCRALVGEAGVVLDDFDWRRAQAQEALAELQANLPAYRAAALRQAGRFRPEVVGAALAAAARQAQEQRGVR